MNGTNPAVLVTDDGGTRRVATIVHWQHPSAGHAHCLARLVLGTPPSRPVFVLTELASNPDAVGITGDFAGAADAAVARLRSYAAFDPDQVTWLAHHGEFSSYDAAGAPESLTEVTLGFDGERYHCDLTDHRLLPAAEADAWWEQLRLAAVPSVLAQLHAPS